VIDFGPLILVTVAIAVGWWLGRRSEQSSQDEQWPATTGLPSQYYRGLNFLLDGSQDNAIDAFTRALEVNSETFDTHIALGNVLRRRGEVERAIRIHQNLLARPSLPSQQLHLAHLELARDYISAGLLDRAERLLLDLVDESAAHRRLAQRHLLEIYEAQNDWEQARKVAEALLPRRSLLKPTKPPADEVGQPIPLLLAHYCCQQAELALARHDWTQARETLREALKYDRQCVRASLMQGELEYRVGEHAKAVAVLMAIPEQDPDFVPQAVPLLRQALDALGRRTELRHWLQQCLDKNPSTALTLALAEECRDTEGDASAKTFLRLALEKKPSLRGLTLLMQLHNASEAGEDERLQIQTLQRLVEARSSYRCQHCGFHGQHLHWYCPGCKHWGTIRDLGNTGEVVRA